MVFWFSKKCKNKTEIEVNIIFQALPLSAVAI